MITRLRIENFKSWRDTGELRFAPLTGFFGANSSGKTAILQFLLMLKQTVDSPDRNEVLNFGDERDPVMLGTFPDVVFQHDRSLPIRWSFNWNGQVSGLSYEAEVVEETGGTLQVRAFHYKEGQLTASLKKRDEGRYTVELWNRGRAEPELSEDIEGPVKSYGFPPNLFPGLPLGAYEMSYEEQFSGVFYLGPLRDYPKREYSWAGSFPSDVGRRGERAVDVLLGSRRAAAKSLQRTGEKLRHVQEYVADWLQDLGLIHEFRIVEIGPESGLYRVVVRRSEDSPEVLLTDVGFGVSQILPVLVLCYYVPEGSTVILEQPEIHLHPQVQARLADVFIDAINRFKIQILLESHSEYLLNRLQRRIAEDNGFTQDEVALYFCSIEDGESRATPLEVDSFGNITNWPRDFFGDEMGDLAARTRAEMERRKAKAG